jgi:hypothetical protein
MAYLQKSGISGSLAISSSNIRVTTTASLLSVDGYAGRLLSVVDNLSGSIFSVNTIAGLPVIEAFSNNIVTLGKYNAADLVVSASKVGIGTGRPDAKLHVSGSLIDFVAFNRQTTANYTVSLSDVGKMVEMNNASANTVTVPTNANVSYVRGTKIDVVQYGAGQTTIAAASGVTLRSANSWTKINARYGVASLVKVGTDEWYLFGNLTP